MKEKFIEFLTDNDALEDFRAGLLGHRKIGIDEYIASEIEEAEDWILGAFPWADTDLNYWNILHGKWYDKTKKS